MKKKLILVGGGGHCKSVLDSLLGLNEYEEIGIVDKKENIGKSVLGVPVVGCDNDLNALFNSGYEYAFVSIGSIGNPTVRQNIFSQLNEIGFVIPSIIDTAAKVSEHAVIEPGVFVGKMCVVNAGAVIHKGAIINSGSIIEHDDIIGEFVHIASGAVLGGAVTVGSGTHIGANSTIKQQVQIGQNSIIGMGSVVLQSVAGHVMAYGNPCKEVKSL